MKRRYFGGTETFYCLKVYYNSTLYANYVSVKLSLTKQDGLNFKKKNFLRAQRATGSISTW